MYGGRIRGQGTYGCVFQPTLHCSSAADDISDPTKVGKITSPLEARIELAAAAALRPLPDSIKYVILPDPSTCNVNPKQADTDIQQCEFLGKTPIEKTIQLIMPWGGYSLSRINLDYRRFNLYSFIEQILAAGTFLVLNDMCHFDIGGHNMLFDTETNIPRIIDFGFAFRPSTLKEEDLPDYWRKLSTEHDTETPEITLVLGADDGMSIDSLIHDLQTTKPAVRRLATLCEMSPSKWGADLLDWSLKSKCFQQHDWIRCWKLYWPGFDAWAIGTVILEVLELQMMTPGFTETPEWISRGEDVKELLRSLCQAHPALRLDAAEALSQWTRGAHPLISSSGFGSNWIRSKQARRHHV